MKDILLYIKKKISFFLVVMDLKMINYFLMIKSFQIGKEVFMCFIDYKGSLIIQDIIFFFFAN